MKLIRIGDAGAERPAVLMDDGSALDASPVAPDDFGPEFLAAGGLATLAAAVDGGRLPRVDLADRRLGAPVTRPGKVICIGLNFADHAAEAGMELPAEPVIFFKAPNTVVGPCDDVLLPIDGLKTDWEVELGVVIGAEARYLESEEAALEVIAGYCISNDVSESPSSWSVAGSG